MTVQAVNVQPAASVGALRWIIDRDPSDTVGTGKPSLANVTGQQTAFQPSMPGNFRLTVYIDRNANGAFDEGEQLRVLRIAVVRVTFQSGSDVFTLTDTLEFAPSVGTVGVASTSDDGTGPFPMTLSAAYLLEGGGASRTIGTGWIRLGNVGNLRSDSFQVSYGLAGVASEDPGGPLPMVDTRQVTKDEEPSGGATPFRAA